MRLLAVALLLAACDGCVPINPLPPPLPVGSDAPPPPVVADAGPTCETACRDAVAACPQPSMTAEHCASRCSEGMKQLTSACPRGLAAVLACNGKSVCP